MAEERDDEQFQETEGKSGQQPVGQQGQQPIAGEQGQQSELGQQQGQQGGDFASQQTMTGGQSSSGQAQGGDGGADIMTNDEGASGGTGTTGLGGGSGGSSGEGFVGSQGSGSDDYLREDDSSETLDRSDFAKQGQGATEAGNENIETGQRQDSESDIEGSSGNS